MPITVTANPSGGVITVAATGLAAAAATIVRTDSAGNTSVVRNGDPATLASGNWTGNDYEAPLDDPVTYEARDSSSGTVLATSSAVTLDSDGRFWLGHPGKPTLNLAPVVKGIQPGTRKARSTTLDIIGKTLPVGQSLRRGSYSGSLVVSTRTENELDALNSLIGDGNVLLMRAPASWVGYGSRYVQIGDVDFEQLIRVPDGRFTVSLPWTEVSRPAGLAQAGPGYRWVDITTAFASWLELYTLNATWDEVLDGFTAPGTGGGSSPTPGAATGSGLLTVAAALASAGFGATSAPGFGSVNAATTLSGAATPGRKGGKGTGATSAATALSAGPGTRTEVDTPDWNDINAWYGHWNILNVLRPTWNDVINMGAP